MDSEQIQKALHELKQQPKRKFSQSYDLIVNLRGINIKTNPLDFFVTLPHMPGKEFKVAIFVDPQLAEQAQKQCDFVIREAQFSDYADKKKARKLAQDYDYFISQANLMPKVATTFGKVLGTKGKMPNPKLGCVVPATANLEPLIKKLRHTIRLQVKKGLNLQCMVGKETQDDTEVTNNILAVYEAALKQLPNERHDIKNVLLKLSMGKPVKVYG